VLLDQPVDFHFELFDCIESHDFQLVQTSCLSLVLRLSLVKFIADTASSVSAPIDFADDEIIALIL
jgi:hypothetical protein